MFKYLQLSLVAAAASAVKMNQLMENTLAEIDMQVTEDDISTHTLAQLVTEANTSVGKCATLRECFCNRFPHVCSLS